MKFELGFLHAVKFEKIKSPNFSLTFMWDRAFSTAVAYCNRYPIAYQVLTRPPTLEDPEFYCV